MNTPNTTGPRRVGPGDDLGAVFGTPSTGDDAPNAAPTPAPGPVPFASAPAQFQQAPAAGAPPQHGPPASAPFQSPPPAHAAPPATIASDASAPHPPSLAHPALTTHGQTVASLADGHRWTAWCLVLGVCTIVAAIIPVGVVNALMTLVPGVAAIVCGIVSFARDERTPRTRWFAALGMLLAAIGLAAGVPLAFLYVGFSSAAGVS